MRAIRLSPRSESDIEQILFHSERSFGETARLRYEALLEAALRDIAADPDRPGVRTRGELGPGLRTYHLFYSRHHGRSEHGFVLRPRHMLIFRLSNLDTVEIGRVLHDAMDLPVHLPPNHDPTSSEGE